MMREQPKEWCSLGNPVSAHPCDQIHTPCDNSPGHPGKTTFLKFMLTQLISAGQVVLLCDSYEVYLFYHGQVYLRLTVFGFGELPRHQHMRYCPIWALIDMDYNDHRPPITSTSNIWPIQASPPNPIQWKLWVKQNTAAVWGMPLWNMEELMQGYVFSLSSLSAINPGCVVQRRFVTDCPSSLLQFTSPSPVQQLSKQTGEVPPAP